MVDGLLLFTHAPLHMTKVDQVVLNNLFLDNLIEIFYSLVKFSLDKPAQLTVVVMGDYQGRTLHLFANAPETDAPFPMDPGVIYYGPGFYDIGKDRNWKIELKDNQTLYIGGGAVVAAQVVANGAKNIRICGRGILTQYPGMPRSRSLTLTECEGIDLGSAFMP